MELPTAWYPPASDTGMIRMGILSRSELEPNCWCWPAIIALEGAVHQALQVKYK